MAQYTSIVANITNKKGINNQCRRNYTIITHMGDKYMLTTFLLLYHVCASTITFVGV